MVRAHLSMFQNIEVNHPFFDIFCLVREASGVALIFMDDCRFIDLIVKYDEIYLIFRKACDHILEIHHLIKVVPYSKGIHHKFQLFHKKKKKY